MKPTAHQRIMRAAKAGRGVRLSADEVWYLSQDDAIASRAAHDDAHDENPEVYDAREHFGSAHTMADRIRWRDRLAELGEDVSRLVP